MPPSVCACVFVCVCCACACTVSLTFHLVCTTNCGSYTAEVLSRASSIEPFTNIFGSMEVCSFPLFHYTIHDLNPFVELCGPISLLLHELILIFSLCKIGLLRLWDSFKPQVSNSLHSVKILIARFSGRF